MVMVMDATFCQAHSEYWLPNSALLQVKEIRAEIKTTILSNPTLKPSAVYAAKVDQVRDTLGEGSGKSLTKSCHQEFRLIQAYMPGRDQ